MTRLEKLAVGYVAALVLILILSACAHPVLRTLPLPKGCLAWSSLPRETQDARAYAQNVRQACRLWERVLGRRVFALNMEVPHGR